MQDLVTWRVILTPGRRNAEDSHGLVGAESGNVRRSDSEVEDCSGLSGFGELED